MIYAVTQFYSMNLCLQLLLVFRAMGDEHTLYTPPL
jgi:hypothetical protein